MESSVITSYMYVIYMIKLTKHFHLLQLFSSLCTGYFWTTLVVLKPTKKFL